MKWPREQVFTSLGTTTLPSLGTLRCPCSGGNSTSTLLLLRHMTANMLFSQADKCFLSITANYVCQLLISSQCFIVCSALNCIFRNEISLPYLKWEKKQNKQTKPNKTKPLKNPRKITKLFDYYGLSKLREELPFTNCWVSVLRSSAAFRIYLWIIDKISHELELLFWSSLNLGSLGKKRKISHFSSLLCSAVPPTAAALLWQ